MSLISMWLHRSALSSRPLVYFVVGVVSAVSLKFCGRLEFCGHRCLDAGSFLGDALMPLLCGLAASFLASPVPSLFLWFLCGSYFALSVHALSCGKASWLIPRVLRPTLMMLS